MKKASSTNDSSACWLERCRGCKKLLWINKFLRQRFVLGVINAQAVIKMDQKGPTFGLHKRVKQDPFSPRSLLCYATECARASDGSPSMDYR